MRFDIEVGWIPNDDNVVVETCVDDKRYFGVSEQNLFIYLIYFTPKGSILVTKVLKPEKYLLTYVNNNFMTFEVQTKDFTTFSCNLYFTFSESVI